MKRMLSVVAFTAGLSPVSLPSSLFGGGDVTLKAWAIDLQNEQAFPIANAVSLQLRR